MRYHYEKNRSYCSTVILVVLFVLFLMYHNVKKVQDESMKFMIRFGNEGTQSANRGSLTHDMMQLQMTPCADITPLFGEYGEQISTEEIPHLHDLQTYNLCLSYRQQAKFFATKDKLLAWSSHTNSILSDVSNGTRVFSYQHYLEPLAGANFFALTLNDEYTFRHIFKNGGSTVVKQTNTTTHTKRDEIGDRKLVATVRDPIDHFLSGWGECGSRLDLQNTPTYGVEANHSYDIRVRNYLHAAMKCRRKKSSDKYRSLNDFDRKFCGCTTHVLPQINYLLYNDHEIDPKIEIVGDIAELAGILDLVGFDFDMNMTKGRDAADNDVKRNYFPKHRDQLSKETLQALCKFVALDYFVFDYEPPLECHEQLRSDFMHILSFSSDEKNE